MEGLFGSPMVTATTAALAGIIFLAYGVQTASGFGAALIALTLGAHLIAIGDLVILVLVLSIGQCAYIAVRYRVSIDWPFLLCWVAPFMGAGTAAGAYAAGFIDSSSLRRILGALILMLSIIELYASARRRGGPPRSIGPITAALALLGAGLMHGVYATGGPLLVYTMGRRSLDKDTFRSTITVVWLALNIGLVSYHATAGHLSRQHGEMLAVLAPVMMLGLIAGERVFVRIGSPRFMQLVFSLLAIAALGLLLR
jgi:hypothetical protein